MIESNHRFQMKSREDRKINPLTRTGEIALGGTGH